MVRISRKAGEVMYETRDCATCPHQAQGKEAERLFARALFHPDNRRRVYQLRDQRELRFCLWGTELAVIVDIPTKTACPLLKKIPTGAHHWRALLSMPALKL